MRNKLALMCCVLLGSLFGLFACNKTPYANMKIEHNLESDSVQILVEETYDDGVVSYKYDPVKFRVTVSDSDKNTDLGVVVSGGESYINAKTQYLGDGVTEITTTLLPLEKTDDFTLNILTKEGNCSLNIHFSIVLKINSFRLDAEKLPAVAKSTMIDLTAIENFVIPDPLKTDQSEMIYSVVTPNSEGRIEGFYTDYDYEYAPDVSITTPYAEIVDNKYLKINSTYAIDDETLVNIPFPKVYKETLPDGTRLHTERITLKVQSKYDSSLVQFVDVDIVGECGVEELQMKEEVNNDFISINKNTNGVYDVIMLDPQFKDGMFNIDTEYYFNRDLIFKVKDGTGENYSSEYEVVCDNVLDSDNKAVCISDLGLGSFLVQSQEAGSYVHKFTIRHTNQEYRGLFDRDVYVKFNVLSLPNKISVNNEDVKVNTASASVSTIYNYYKSSTNGTKFNVNMNSNYNYFVYLDDTVNESIVTGLTLRKNNDRTPRVLGQLVHNGVDYEVVSAKEDSGVTYFGNKDSFYLSLSPDVAPIPQETLKVFVGIAYSMKADSYDSELDKYFKNPIHSFPINIKFENTIKSLAFERSSYDINLVKNEYVYNEDDENQVVDPVLGFKLLTIPESLSYEKTIKTLTYDKDLITIYQHLNDDNCIELYAKCNDDLLEGETRVYIEAFNGLNATTSVETYIPTAYVNSDKVAGQDGYMPLAAEVDTYSSGFLYYMTGADANEHQKEHIVYGPQNTDIAAGDINYTSVSTLFMITNAEQKITFYDYIVTKNKEDKYISDAVDITSKVRVEFDRSNFAKYKNGIISSNGYITSNIEGGKDIPIVMTVTYNTGYEEFDELDRSYKQDYQVVHKILLYIYDPLQGIEVETAKAADLYISDSLGVANKALASHTIISTYLPSKNNLGANWNSSDAWGDGVEWQPVALDYEYEELWNSPVIKADGTELKIVSADGSTRDIVYYSDLFEVSEDYDKYQCTVKCRLSDRLNNWIKDNYDNQKELFLSNIFKHNIVFTVTIYIRQFNKLQNINSVVFTAKYADRIGELTLDIDDDGLYFEARRNENNELVVENKKLVVNYSIDNADVINKNLELIYDNESALAFKAKVIPNSTGNSGVIEIELLTQKDENGKSYVIPNNYNLTVTPQDNIKSNNNGKVDYYVASIPLKQTFSIRIVDGSEGHPFEIRTAKDYLAMIQDIKNGNYFSYIITRNIDLNGQVIESIDIPYIEGSTFRLSGKQYQLSLQQAQFISKYSTIYNMNIKKYMSEITSENVGLFGSLSSSAIIDNLSIKNAKISIIDNQTTAKSLNVGMIAGQLNGATITESGVQGLISINRQYNFSSLFNVGAMVGVANGGIIEGLPGNNLFNTNASVNNTDVTINITRLQTDGVFDNTSSVTNINVGGVAGELKDGAILKDLQVSSLITSEVVSNLAGVVGLISENSEGVTGVNNAIVNVVASPKIVANLQNGNTLGLSNALVIGGLVGITNSQYKLIGNKIVAVDIGGDDAYSWQDRANIYVYAPNNQVVVGGFVGLNESNASEFSYNYLRSYYNSIIGSNYVSDTVSYDYYGNIFVYAKSGSVGGLIGRVDSELSMRYSYFDGDIVSNTGMNNGTLLGSVNSTSPIDITGCYSIGYLGVVEEQVVNDVNTKVVSLVSDIGENGIIGGYNYSESEASLVLGTEVQYTYSQNISMKQSYAVINNTINYYALSENNDNKIYGLNQSLFGKLNLLVAKVLLGNVTGGEDADVNAFDWFYYDGLNTIKDSNNNIVSYPVILRNGKVWFDLVPTQINVKFNNKPGLYDITINNLDNSQQVIMYLNKNISNNSIETYYDVALVSNIDNNTTSAIKISLAGATISTTYINTAGGAFLLDDRIEISEDSRNNIIRIDGSRVYPVSEGYATLTIRSYVVKSLKVDIDIVVVKGITDFELYSNNLLFLSDEERQPQIDAGLVVEPNIIYVDEISDFAVHNINNDKYEANENSGFVLEILDGDGEIVLKGKDEYSDQALRYDNTNINNNVKVFNSRTFKLAGVLLGNINVKITPFININNSNYISTYTLANGDVWSDNTLKDVYLLHDMAKTYSFDIMARARSVYNEKSALELKTQNEVNNSLVLETANVYIDTTAKTFRLNENVLIKIGQYFTKELNLKSLGSLNYISNKYEFNGDLSQLDFSYQVLKFTFESITLEKTDVDVISRNNTYKIYINYKISFDKNHYRKNAELYNLDALNYNIQYIPETRNDLVDIVKVELISSTATTIIPRFYTKAEGRLDDNIEDAPEENASGFIVPGRSGLLKITFDQEFDNTSYVTVTFDLKYLGFISIYQLSGIVESDENFNLDNQYYDVDEIVGYNRLSSNRIIFMDKNGAILKDNSLGNAVGFGIKLSKLSLNYSDTNYFNNTYFVEILLDKEIDATTITPLISLVKMQDNKTSIILDSNDAENPFVLKVSQLPFFNVAINGEVSAPIGVGVKKELEIVRKNLSKNINFTINSDYSDYVYIVDNNENKVTSLDINYMQNSTNKYYVWLDIAAGSNSWGNEIEILFVVEENIDGVLETINSKLVLDIVKFEIKNVKYFGVEDSFTLNHGQTLQISAEIEIEDLIGSAGEIEEYKALIAEDIKFLEYSFAGTKVSSYVGAKETILAHDALDMYYRVMVGDKADYQPVYIGTYRRFTIAQDVSRDQNDYEYLYYVIKGTSISNDTNLLFEVNYYYDSDGKVQVGNDAVSVHTRLVYLDVIIADNSTYDHPTPIENQTDLFDYVQNEGEYYILTNNIVLEDWAPIPAKCATLDGNGYTITIKSFDLSASQGKTGVDVGIFSTISQNTLIKNVIIDVSPLLKSNQNMINDISAVKASTKDTYKYNANIDLAYTSDIRFGVLAGTNNGAITNAKIINLSNSEDDVYLHVVTTLGHVNGNVPKSEIGGIVGVNSETGAISNSFVGLNYSNVDGESHYVEMVTNPSVEEKHNEEDELVQVETYPFVLAGANMVGGVASSNSGVISNTYNKAMGIYNTFPDVENSYTGGLVVNNTNIITSSFVEGRSLDENLRAENDKKFNIISSGLIGGFVYSNTATIENSYANAYLQTQSSCIGGFVYKNTGSIANSYSTAVNKNSQAVGQFTGIQESNLAESGTYTNCFYMVLRDDNGNAIEEASPYEKATPISSTDIAKASAWTGFSFAVGVNADGIWQLQENSTPKIVSTLTDTVSFRRLTDIVITENGDTQYDYSYATYLLGTAKNPLVIDNADNFNVYIIDHTHKLTTKTAGEEKTETIFGYSSSLSATRHVRIVNNLDFSGMSTATEVEGTYLYKTIFAGVLDGNGMTLKNLTLHTENADLENFGLFAQIGHEKVSSKAVVKNLNIEYQKFSVGGSSKSGVLAGTITNAGIINVKIASTGSTTNTITGINLAGGLAGLVYSSGSQSVSLIDVSVEKVKVFATHKSLGAGGGITSESIDKSNNQFSSFTVDNNGVQTTDGKSFSRLYENDVTNLDKLATVSYAGGVVGAIVANNDKAFDFSVTDVSKHRTNVDACSIDGILVKNDVEIIGDHAGGLFGYVGENTRIKNAKFELNVNDESGKSNQLIQANNSAGAIVGENHGVIEKSYVDYSDINSSNYDKTLTQNVRTHGSFDLFDLSVSANSNHYTVAIGGIAGYSENGAIIDCYSKVNVVKNLSFIAGGIIGYAKGNNYLAYVYSTGAVYSNSVTGGIIGLQVNSVIKDGATQYDMNDNVYMYHVYALNDWNASFKDTSYVSLLTKRLYDNYVEVYYNENTYDKFYIKMPEVGNSGVLSEDETTIESDKLNKDYIDNHTGNFVGSVVGQVLGIYNEELIFNGVEAVSTNTPIFVDKNQFLVNKIFNSDNISSVISSTLGLVKRYGSIDNNSRYDEYFEEVFTLNSDNESVTCYSYRVAYREDDSLNAYTPILTSEGNNGYLDKLSFTKIFTAQEYVPQILGDGYYLSSDVSYRTRNILSSGYNSDRSKTFEQDKFVSAEDIWVMNGYLPKFTLNSVANTISISDASELVNAFTSVVLGKTYYLAGGTQYNISFDDSLEKSIAYMSNFSSVLIGLDKDADGNPVDKPVINITIESGSKISSIFNSLSNSILKNIDFNIIINNTASGNVDYANYGLFVNSLDSTSIDGCSIKITFNNYEFNNATNFDAENVGLLFGEVNNSQIINSKFIINATSLTINNSNISNFGLLSGRVINSYIKSCDLQISDVSIINNNSNDLAVGGIAGYSANTTFIDNDLVDNAISISNNKANINLSISSLFANTLMNNVKDIVERKNNLSSIKFTNTEPLLSLNIGSIYGKSSGSTINDYIVNNNSESNITVTSTALIDEVNIGGIIGCDIADTKLGQNALVGSYASISVVDVLALELSVGGIIGKVTDSYYFANDVFVDCDINVNNSQQPTKTETINIEGNTEISYSNAYTHVGGIVGYSVGKIGLTNIISSGSIVTNVYDINVDENNSDWITDHFGMCVGGIVGYSSGNSRITNFVAMNNIDADDNNSCVYISGILGRNKGVFVGKYGYSYIELPQLDKSITSAVTNASRSSDCNNVYYAQEFIGNNYYSDSNFVGFAMADLVESVSEYSQIYSLVNGFEFDGSNNYYPMKACVVGKLSMPLPFVHDGEGLEDLNNDISQYLLEKVNTLGSDRFNPNSQTLTRSNTNKYRVILTDKTGISADLVNNVGDVISGRSTSSGKVVVTFNGSNFVTTNNGIISNIYLNTDSKKVALANTNNGLITNCFVYGITKSNYAFAGINNGQIYKSASAIRFTPTEGNTALFGLVDTNNGIISDNYSMSFGYTESSVEVTNLYGFANQNTASGSITYSYYFVADAVLHDNKDNGYVVKDDGSIVNCYKGQQIPKSLISRNAIWTTENEHAQLLGFKDVTNSMFIRLSVDGVEISNVQDLTNKLKSNKNAELTYAYDFYGSENLAYSVVRISSSDQFVAYINSCTNGVIPANTIVMFTNNKRDEESNIIKINASLLPKFSLGVNAAIIGIDTRDSGVTQENPLGIVLDFSTYSGALGSMSHELIGFNNGLIANIIIKQLAIDKSKSCIGFAPILQNNGTIINLEFNDVTTRVNVGVSYTSGIINVNTGYVDGLILKDSYISSSNKVYMLCVSNSGTIKNYNIINSEYLGTLAGSIGTIAV